MSVLPSDTSTTTIPSGTVTFVFTDIEGSTQRWDRDRAAMEVTVRRHDVLMREAIAAHHGHVFKTIGDAFCAAFSKPEDAVAAMFDVQRALCAEDFSAVDGLRVRAAIHTGTADERDRDYFGPAVNRVARLLGIAHGGQVLVSGVTSDLVRGALPQQASLRDLGEHRLKDLSRPEYIYQLLGPGLIADFPPLRSLGTLPNNLPAQLKSFVGRETEIADLTALLRKHRIVTIVGSGGIGKTLTSLQVAANLLDGSGDGVWFFELAPLTSGDYIPQTIAQAMGLTLASDGDPLGNLVRTLASKRALLVFDNCEHLIDAAAQLIARVTRECPHVDVLASSRQALGITGEATYRMPSLGFPSETVAATLTATGALAFPALVLFVDRARASDHRFELTDDNAPIVADICRRLDGIALAIELASSRVKILSPRQLRDRLSERFRLLTGGSRDLLPRQQTLVALIDWSYDLLSEQERTLFRKLGIFVDGFSIEGAVAVASDSALDEFEVFDLVASLVEKSLLLAEPSGDTLRYRLLESTRAYALEKLAAAGEREAAARAHLEFFRERFVALAAEHERTGRYTDKLAAFEAELDDLRVALDGAVTRPGARAGAELLGAIERLWEIFGLEREGIARAEALAAALAANEFALHAKLANAIAALLVHAGNHVLALATARRAVAHARAGHDDATLAYALLYAAWAELKARDFVAAERALAEAEGIANASTRLRLQLLSTRAELGVATGDLDAATAAYEQLRADARARGNTRNDRILTLQLSEIEMQRGRKTAALALLDEILPALRRGGDPAFLATALTNRAHVHIVDDAMGPARAAAVEAIDALAPREPDHFMLANAIACLALVIARDGDVARAARLVGYAEAAATRHGTQRGSIETATHARLTEILRTALPAGDLAALTTEGEALTPEAAIALARA